MRPQVPLFQSVVVPAVTFIVSITRTARGNYLPAGRSPLAYYA